MPAPSVARRVVLALRPDPARLSAIGLLLLVAGCETPAPPPPVPPVVQAVVPSDRAIPPGAVVALQKRFPDLHVIARSIGPLQLKDVDDLAVVMAPIGEHGDYVIALLSNGPAAADATAAATPGAAAANTPSGSWRVTAASVVLNPGCGLCSASVNIVQHALFVHVIQAQGVDFTNVTYQFAYRDGDTVPRLVGVNTYQPEETDDPIPHSYSNSADLITGKKLDEMEDSEDDKPRHREVRSTLALRPTILFDKFSFAPDALEAETSKLPASSFEQSAPLPARMLRQLQARYPTMKEQSRASGSLRPTGAHDVAVVLAPSSEPVAHAHGKTVSTPTTPVVVVLLPQPDGNMQLAAASPPLSRACVGCDVQVLIARRVLTVQMTATDAASAQTLNYQFAFRPGDNGGAPQLRLIATRTETVSHTTSGDTRRYVNSTDLLTGNKLDVIANLVGGKSQRAERKSQVPVRAPILLNSFTFDPGALPAEMARDFVPPPPPPPPPPAPQPAASAASGVSATTATPAGAAASTIELPPLR